ncbi:hypothetical protein VRU48_19345 [Pedobacter sp. KR3-3]|uniref:Uncharacterized protein n=1 Tax=Pedobacter albus TaxID=3113905 RepID=A0ABU7ICR9_9SPHI|nr:hypothetical protein [Pedobacter sp. KR3-3]MEE1947290.1 hypothetical protein [Pedobacter sp. KR3-3]
MMRCLIAFALVAVFCWGCGGNENVKRITLDSLVEDKPAPKPAPPKDSVAVQQQPGSPARDSVMLVASRVLQSLKNKDYRSFASYFHPKDPVLFSPYGNINVANSKKLLAKDFLESIEKNWTLTWGVYDGTGESMKIKVVPYIEKFIYDADYLQAKQTSFDQVVQKGNSLNNMAEVFPGLHFVDFHVEGKDPQYSGMDWRSLRLVFKMYNNEYYLVAVIHDQWTI